MVIHEEVTAVRASDEALGCTSERHEASQGLKDALAPRHEVSPRKDALVPRHEVSPGRMH